MDVNVLLINNLKLVERHRLSILTLFEKSQVGAASPLLYPQDSEALERNLSDGTENFVALFGEHVVGYSALRKMNPWPKYLDFCPNNPEECALFLINLVDPDHRNKGIGRKLTSARIEAAKTSGFHHLYSTVHPDNKPSIRALRHFGFQCIAQQEMFTSKLVRNLMYLDLRV